MRKGFHLKFFLSISLGIHLLFFLLFSSLNPEFKIDRFPPLPIEISLFPLIPETRASSNPIPRPRGKEENAVSNPATEFLNPLLEVPAPFLEKEEFSKDEKEGDPIILQEEQKVESHLAQDEVKIVSAFTPSVPSEWKIKNEELGEKGKEEKREEIKPSEPMTVETKLSSPSGNEALLIPPQLAVHFKPIYPEEARRKGYEGRVVLRVEVLPDGQVGKIELKTTSGYEILDRPAMAAVKQWKFIPANKGEKSIPYWVTVPIKFQLQ